MPATLTESERELVARVAELVLTPEEQRALLAENAAPDDLLDVVAELNNKLGIGPKGGQLQVLLNELRRIYGLAAEAIPVEEAERAVQTPEEAAEVQAELEAIRARHAKPARPKEPLT